ESGRVALWTMPDGKVVNSFVASTDGIYALAFTPDGKDLAVAGDVPRIVVWDFSNDTVFRQLYPQHTGRITSVAFSPDGTLLASASTDGTVVLWDSATWLPIGKLPPEHGGDVDSVAFSPDSKLLASGGGGHTGRNQVILWD